MILMNHGKPELSVRPSAFHSPRTTSESSVFRPFVITNSISVLAQADPIFSFSAVVHDYWLEFKLEYGAMVASVFHAIKHAIKACFLGWHFLWNKYFSTL